jgi:hypothetical protein
MDQSKRRKLGPLTNTSTEKSERISAPASASICGGATGGIGCSTPRSSKRKTTKVNYRVLNSTGATPVAGPKASVGSSIRSQPGGGGRDNDSCDNGMGGDAQRGGISFGFGSQTVRQAVSHCTPCTASASRPPHPRIYRCEQP